MILLKVDVVQQGQGRIGAPVNIDPTAREGAPAAAPSAGPPSAPPAPAPVYGGQPYGQGPAPAAPPAPAYGGQPYGQAAAHAPAPAPPAYGGYGAPAASAAPAVPSYAGGGGHLLAGEPAFPIDSLNPYQQRWTIKARVTSKSEIRTWHNARGEGKLFSIELLDDAVRGPR
jgi:hypothetical protein